MKRCFKCGIEQPLDQFYAHPQMRDRHLNKCKACAKKDTAARAVRKQLEPEWVKSERARCRAKQDNYRSLGIAAPSSREASRRWNAAHPEAKYAHTVAKRAVERGIIPPRSTCEECGATGELHKHHDDYLKPLTVRWLCTKCHGLTRRKSK